MTTDQYILLSACALGAVACLGWVRAERRAQWRNYQANSWAGLCRRACAREEAFRSQLREAQSLAAWRIVRVDTTGRGPNADTFYHVPPPCPDGREAWFTDEQLLGAKLRPDTTAKRTYETP